MQYFEKMIQEGIMPSQQTMSESAEDVLLGSGTLAMATQGSWMLSAFKENEYIAQNCDCVELPKDAASGKRVSIYNGLGWAASADFNLQAYLNMMDDMVIRPYSRETVTWENDVNEELKKGWTQEVTMEEACMNAAATMNETLDEENAG